MSDGTLIESFSPNGNLMAFAEQDSRVAYLYLGGAEESGFGMRSCWVRNLAPAPERLDAEQMREGEAPMLPRACCAHPEGAEPLRPLALEIVWFEEGDAVALFEAGELLAVIPGWSGQKGFDGYARDCIAESPVCWPLKADSALHPRLRRAREFWRSWEEGEPWPGFRDATLAALEAGLGKHSRYFAIDGGQWPPKALLQFSQGPQTVLATCGVSLRPQPKAEQVEGAARHIELGVAVETSCFERNPRAIQGYLSGQTALPWSRFTYLGQGHTVPCDAIPISPTGTRFEAVLLLRDPPGAPPVALPAVRGEPASLFWMVPITAAERDFAIAQGSRALAERLAAAGQGWVHRYRESVV